MTSEDDTRDSPTRLTPRPTHRPHVSQAQREVFARPDGLHGSFSRPEHHSPSSPQPQIHSPDPILAEAFSRPEGTTGSLERDPNVRPGTSAAPVTPPDPWRDPNAPASLSDPAVAAPLSDVPHTPGPKLGVRDVLFGRRVSWRALAALGVVALLIGVVGGWFGRVTAEVHEALTSHTVTLNNVGSNPSASNTAIEKVVANNSPAVVTIQTLTSDASEIGSGFVIDGHGYIITNNHVIEAAANNPDATLTATFSDGHTVPARVVGRDPKTDIAVIKVSADNLTVAQMGDSQNLTVGEQVIAIGAPLGFAKTVTTGIVSALHRAMPINGDDGQTATVLDAIQTDAAINHGNSGGPLFDDSGRVVGVNSAILSSGPNGGSIGLGFAIPIDEARGVAQSLIRTGTVKHPDIGAQFKSVANKTVTGAGVVNVKAGSPADRAGLKEGDVIVSFDGKTVADGPEMIVAIRKSQAGKPHKLVVIRSAHKIELTVTPIDM